MKLSSSLEGTIGNTIDFICELQFKDTIKGDAAETQASASAAAAYLSACLKTDNLSEVDRERVISSYVELNPYYKELYEKYGIEPYISRLAKDMDIISQSEQKVLNYPYLYHYRTIYKECLQSFYITSYSQSMVHKENYRNLCLLTVNVMSFVNLMHRWLETPFDIDLMDEFQIDKFMHSFGISYFKSLPIKYKQLIARNLNRLISNKGTDKVVIDILEIFSFKDIEIQKYYLARQATLSDTEKGDTDYRTNPEHDVQFLSHNIKVPSLNIAIKNNDYRKYSYESIVNNDPYWQVEKTEVLALDFDYVQTKYFSIETGFELGTETTNTVLMLNLLRRIRDDFPNREALIVNSNIISESNSVALEDIVLALHILTCEYQGIVDEIHYELEGIAGVYNFAKYDLPAMNNALFADNPNLINSISNIALTDLRTVGLFDSKTTFAAYEQNLRVRDNLEKYLLAETNYKKFKRLKNAYNAKFIQKLSYEMFDGYPTYTAYLQTRNIDLYNIVELSRSIVDPDEKRSNIEETISNLTDVVNGALDKFGIFLGTTSLNIVVGYLKKVILAFKSFTVSLKDLNVFVVMREQYETKLLDELRHLASLTVNVDKVDADDDIVFITKNKLHTIKLMLDHTKIFTILPRKDKFTEIKDLVYRITSNSDLMSDKSLHDDIAKVMASVSITYERAELEDALSIVSTQLLRSIKSISDNISDVVSTINQSSLADNHELIRFVTTFTTKYLTDQQDVLGLSEEDKINFIGRIAQTEDPTLAEALYILANGLIHNDITEGIDNIISTSILPTYELERMIDAITNVNAIFNTRSDNNGFDTIHSLTAIGLDSASTYSSDDKMVFKTILKNSSKQVAGTASIGFQNKERLAPIDTFKIHQTP